MNTTLWSIAGLMVFFVSWFIATARSERAAIRRRSERLASRPPTTIDDWQRLIPSVDTKTITEVLPLIGLGLGIPHRHLHPSDSFDDELCLKDRFWSLIADDDSRESIADAFDSRYTRRPSGDWNDLRDVVLETCLIVQDCS